MNMKKIIRYFLLFLLLFIVVGLLTRFAMKEKYIDMTNYSVNVSSPKVTIDESKSTYSSGYIKGSIANDTGEHIKDKCLQFAFYDKDGVYLGTETKEIKYFNVNEEVKFNIKYNYNNVGRIELNFTNLDDLIK